MDTITVVNTRRGYAVTVNRMVADFGADTNVRVLARAGGVRSDTPGIRWCGYCRPAPPDDSKLGNIGRLAV